MYPIKPLFQKTMKVPSGPKISPVYISEDDKLECGLFSQSRYSVPVEFCLDTSLHGLKYLGQKRRHVAERIFWLAAFLASTITSAILIYGMWQDYKNMPIVTVFQPTEITLDEIPFPSITICNVNGLQKSTAEKFNKKAGTDFLKQTFGVSNPEETNEILAKIVDMTYICDSCLTFIDRFVGNTSLLQIVQQIKEKIGHNMEDVIPYLDPTATLYNVSQPCKDMIMGCIWQSVITDCSQLFHEIITDFALCCTFNSIPASLLTKQANNSKVVKKWRKLDLSKNLSFENLLFPKSDKAANRKIPYRQKYPGRKAGLSVLLNPDLDEYHCTNTDSEGFMMGINTPLDFPRIKDKAIAIRTQSEVFVGIRPEITVSDKAIKRFPLEKRKCYFGNEYSLSHYTKYSTSNCMDECIAKLVKKECNCVRYYMPRNYSNPDELCKPHEFSCSDKIESSIMRYGLNASCPYCLPTCTEIDYRREVTVLPLQKKKMQLYHQLISNKFSLHSSQVEQMSIVHVYFDVDSIYPRLRKEVTTITQLLSNTGGLLGLCMGFSVLSLLEIFYYVTIRVCFSYYQDKTAENDGNSGNSTNDDEQAPQSWLSKVFKKMMSCGNIDKTQNNNIQQTRDEDFSDDDNSDVFKTPHNKSNKLPVYFQSSFENDSHRSYLSNFHDTKFMYPKK